MLQKVVVITRQFSGHGPVVSEVILIPKTVGHEESFASYRFEDHREDFCGRFVEFSNAVWSYSIHNLKEVTF